MYSFLVGALMGAPWVISFAPMAWWWFGLLLVTALPFVAQSAHRPWLCGLAFGWSAYGIGVSWLHISLHTYGELPFWLACLSVAGFALYLAIFPALAVYGYFRLRSDKLSQSSYLFNALLWSGLWTFFEWLRGTFMTGFAWLSLGDAFVDSPFANLLPWVGSYGALFLLMVLAHLLIGLSINLWVSRNLKPLIQGSFMIGSYILSLVLLLQLPIYTQTAGLLPVVGVQTNVDQSIKFDPDLIVSNMDKAFFLGDIAKQKLLEQGGGMLVFPETVNPLVWTDTPQEWQTRFRDFAIPNQLVVLLGSAIQEGSNYHNSIVMFKGNETLQDLRVPKDRHDKRHLVPFGEFIPWGFRWFVAMLNMPMGEFNPGSGSLKPFLVNHNVLASTVCYEDIFSGEFAEMVSQSIHEPTVFVNLSNLAWFGKSWALDQHAQMGRTRSAEHRKPGLRVTNTGLSGLVNEYGQWEEQARPSQALVWSGQLEGRLGKTFFAKWGDTIWFSIWAVILLLISLCKWQQKAYNRAY
jgi:apolipoprotein N-acyltransferase